MCGFAGILSTAPLREEALQERARAMGARLAHRGPDGDGLWVDAAQGIALAHRRLSILDVSSRGAQPMQSADGRWVIAYNGEIYNFRALWRELAALGHALRGHSDTEVLLAAVSEWGPSEAIRRSIGMFAFALWDRHQRKLYLGRDRVGKKPLYYGWVGSALAFASELKSLRALPGFDPEIDREALSSYLRLNAVPGTASIYRGVRKLTPGTLRCFDAESPAAGVELRYWSARDAAETARRAPIEDAERAVNELEALLRDAVALRLESDVPLGAFLSGGIDSSLVVALMQSQSERRTQTFSIGFHVEGYDEAKHAAAVARHLGTQHTELYVSPEDAQGVIPHLPEIYDEPFCDASQIPTYLVSRLARSEVTVALSGDGGDELFAGYPRYAHAARLWRRAEKVPRPLRRLGASVLRSLLFDAIGGVGARVPGGDRWAERAELASELMGSRNPLPFYRAILASWRERESPVRGATWRLPAMLEAPPPALRDLADLASFADQIGYLPDDILVKVDRASMAVSLEVRAPLLDHRILELSWRFPLSIKQRNGQAKWPMRRVLERYVPAALFDRPKMGFGIPIGQWLRGSLRPWAEALLAPGRLEREGFFHAAPVRRRWERHVAGDHDYSTELWSVLMFQAWLEHTQPSRYAEQPLMPATPP